MNDFPNETHELLPHLTPCEHPREPQRVLSKRKAKTFVREKIDNGISQTPYAPVWVPQAVKQRTSAAFGTPVICTNGRPKALASNTAIPNPSRCDGTTAMALSLSKLYFSSSVALGCRAT